MAMVGKSKNTKLGRFVARKFLLTNVAHHAPEPDRFRGKGRAASALTTLVLVLLLCVPAVAGDDVTLVFGRPLVGNSVGRATYGSSTWDVQQSAKTGVALGLEYRHWFANRFGIQLDYNRTSTNAIFNSLSFDGSLSFPVTRHEISGGFVRHFGRPESRLRPFFNLGPGILLFVGGNAPGGNVGWSAAPELVLGGGLDTPISGHLSLRTAYRFQFFRNTDFGDPQFHPGLAHVQQPMVGLSWKF